MATTTIITTTTKRKQPFIMEKSSSRVMISSYDLLSSCQPWLSVKSNLYECWLCVYEPIFWLVYSIFCSMEAHHKYQKNQAIIDTMVYTYEEEERERHDYWLANNNSSDSNESNNTNTTTTTTMITTTDTPTSSDDDYSASIRSTKSFKHTIKGHFQTFRQKQQTLNQAMKRSLLRKASKTSLPPAIELPHDIEIKPSKSTCSTASSPPSLLSSPLSSSPTSMHEFSFDHQQCNNNKPKQVHPLALEARTSLSDSLLKSLNKKRKQPSLPLPPPPPPITIVSSSSNQSNNVNFNHHYLSKESSSSFSPYFDSSSSTLLTPPPAFYHRRKTAPEIVSLSKK
ncbi:uncharacterized protein BX664DRAFT_29273 [Halteromyces radiatus]|uniref:uncharacterized protein n=1 Tax=Halteromyces radiatus TaxID=101107 RepID=UPI00221E552B|nr:uncharacterized protein BX664DRAFT_29273 [Halteromyces radiatus]KAI8099865.1 hypothetical protein BX664DRAFT_29273 [Halteromyces radiatus]